MKSAPLARRIQGFAGQPREGDDPIFDEPWQAQAFALALVLHQRGIFSWTEWAAALTTQISAAQSAGDPDLGDTYYHHWLAALESLVAAKGLVSKQDLSACAQAWAHAAGRTPHGQPIELQVDDFHVAADRA